MTEKISAGSPLLDRFLDGGFESGIVTTIYGPAGSGKTNICILALIRLTGMGKKIVYIDTESSFSVERLQQITKYAEKVLESMLFFKPSSFEEQQRIVEKLPRMLTKDIGMIVIDTISMLYRLELGQRSDIHKINAALAKQIALLIWAARTYDIPVIVTNQVYSDFNDKEKVKMVGGDILKNGSRCLIELQSLANGRRLACLKKHRSLPERTTYFYITEKGIEKKR
ncbi:DNA repair and recombination protein RadB [Candidatus Woesearchaeota archaeon]|nr:DNA repair and recombination protein RadB [Candidatus Woesearchaeota archaeon]